MKKKEHMAGGIHIVNEIDGVQSLALLFIRASQNQHYLHCV